MFYNDSYFDAWAGFDGGATGVGEYSGEMDYLNGRRPVMLYKRSSTNATDWKIVDDFGGNGEDASGDPWRYDNAWVKRKIIRFQVLHLILMIGKGVLVVKMFRQTKSK